MASGLEDYRVTEIPAKHPSTGEVSSLVFGALLGLLGAIIGLELLTRVGITPNTSVIGAIIIIAASRAPLAICSGFRRLERQNLMQTATSAATFGGANALLLPMGILWLLGVPRLVPVMFLGAVLGMLIDAFILYRVFDSQVYPAENSWPPGVATAECLIAGDRGGRRALLLGYGMAAGGIGRFVGVPMDIVGVCWIGNFWALVMFAIGLLIAGYSAALLGVRIEAIYLPHGVMVGAGAVAIFQMVLGVVRREKRGLEPEKHTRSRREFGAALAWGFVAFALAGAVLAFLAGLFSGMPPGRLIAFVFLAALAALASELIVGISAMHAGWFPAFATALIFLVLGLAAGFPPLALALLVGFTASTGPAFADMGYDFKTGWILRGRGQFAAFELEGRKQQLYAALLGFAVALIVVFLSYQRYFSGGLFPPVDHVFVATIRAGAGGEVARHLLLWAVPGAIIQVLGGASRQAGILLATGLLVNNPVAGWTALAALIIRAMLARRFGREMESPTYVLAGGFIAGSAVTGFVTATLELR